MSVPSFKPVILYQQIRRDGSCHVKMRVTHKRKTKYLPTTVTAQKGEYDKEYKLKSAILLRLSDLMKQIDAIIESKNTFEWEKFSVDQVCDYITMRLTPDDEFRLDFFEWAEVFMSRRSDSSAVNYRTAIHSFQKFLDKKELDISQVTSSLMRRFETWLVDKHGRDARAVSLYTSATRIS